MSGLIKNLPMSETFKLADQVDYEKGRVVSLTFSQQKGVGGTIFAFDEGESLSTHAAGGDALLTVLDGEAEIVIDGNPNRLKAGDAIVMPVGIPHSVEAITAFKMLLVVVNKTE